MNINNINPKILKNHNSYKKVRIIAGVISPIVILGSLTGCFKKDTKSYNNYDYNSNNSSYSNYYDQDSETTYDTDSSVYESSSTSDYNNKYTNTELDGWLNKRVNVNSSDVNNLIYQIKSAKVYYNGSDFYDLNNMMNKYNKLNNYSSKTKNIFSNNKITETQLFNIVKANNEKANLKSEKKISDQILKKICGIMANTINYYIANNKVDLNLLSEKLVNLKIENYSEFSNGAYGQDESLMTFAVQKISKTEEFFKMTVEHECVHLIQAGSKEEQQNIGVELRYGPCYKFKDAKINSLFWNWFYEGTAEYLTLNYNNKKETEIYKNYIKAIDSIKVASIINSRKSVDSFEKLAFNNKIQSIFDYFNCQTDEEKKEILNMMVSFDIILDAGQISKDYSKINGFVDSKIKSSLKASIAQTLTKQFYYNLAKTYENKECSLKEIFSLISIFENEMSRLTWYASTGDKEQLIPFIDTYNSIQRSYFEVLSKKLGLSTDELLNMYSSYNSNYIVQANDINTSNDKKEYYNYILQTRKNDKFKSIYEISQTKYKGLRSGK